MDAWAEAIEVHRDPGPEGYGHTQRLTGSMTATPQGFPDVALPLTEIFA